MLREISYPQRTRIYMKILGQAQDGESSLILYSADAAPSLISSSALGLLLTIVRAESHIYYIIFLASQPVHSL